MAKPSQLARAIAEMEARRDALIQSTQAQVHAFDTALVTMRAQMTRTKPKQKAKSAEDVPNTPNVRLAREVSA